MITAWCDITMDETGGLVFKFYIFGVGLTLVYFLTLLNHGHIIELFSKYVIKRYYFRKISLQCILCILQTAHGDRIVSPMVFSEVFEVNKCQDD